MSELFQVICHCALFIFSFGLVNRLIQEELYFSEPMFSLIYGISIGPHFLNILDPNYFTAKDVLFHTSRAVLCLQTMAAGMLLPHRYIYREWRSIVFLVVIIGFTNYLITFFIIYYFSKYNAMTSFAISACLTPTDPILSASIIKSKFADNNIPERLRHLLAAESGINDGFGFLLLFLPIDLSLNKHISDGVSDLFFSTIIYKTIFPAIIGILIGYFARKLVLFSYANNTTSTDTFIVYGFTLSSFVLGLFEILKMNDLVGQFFTGTFFCWNEWFVCEARASRLQEVTDTLITTSFFIFFGTRINFDKVNGNLILSTLVIICCRRVIACIVLYRFVPLVEDKGEAVLIGWFGPIGVGALYYSLFFDRMMGTITIDVVSFIVMASVIVHGLSIPVMKIIKQGGKQPDLCELNYS